MAQFRHREGLLSMPFTYDTYLDIVTNLLKANKVIFIKHDVYFSLERAVEMAEFESKSNIKSVYFISFSSPYYNVMDKDSIEKIRMLTELGHGIGLLYPIGVITNEEKEMEAISAHKFLLESYGNINVDYVSFQGLPKPKYEFITRLQLVGLISPEFDNRYSHVEDGVNEIEINPGDLEHCEKFLLSIHPIWWGEESMQWEQRLLSLRLDSKIDKILMKDIQRIEQAI